MTAEQSVPDRVVATDSAVQLLTKLSELHGGLMIHQSGGCCDGSSPMCFPAGDFTTGASDVLLGVLELPGEQGGWIIDTPGIRSFGLAHVQPEHLIEAFPDLDEMTEECPRGCTHEAGVLECALDEWAAGGADSGQPGESGETDGRAERVDTVAADADTVEQPRTAGDSDAARTARRARVDSFRRLLAPSLEAEDPTIQLGHRR